MGEKNGLEGLVVGKKPVKCQACGGRLCYTGGGRYRCPLCGREAYDDFGKIRKFLEDNGPSPPIVISQATGVASEVVKAFQKKNFVSSGDVKLLPTDKDTRMKKPRFLNEQSNSYYLKCSRCGDGISSGRYCTTCIRELAGGIKEAIRQDSIRRQLEAGADGEMRFLGKRIPNI